MTSAFPESPTALLQKMVRFKTVNQTINGEPRPEQKLSQWLKKLADQWGLESRHLACKGQADQLLILYQTTAKAPWLMFDSHMDTVGTDGMTIDPIGGILTNGRVYGRGSVDTKGTGAAMLWALRSYAANSIHPNNIAMLFSVDEEVSMQGIQYFVKHDYPNLGFVPKAAIVGEPTELLPVITHNGVIRWTLVTHGIAAHASVPHQGRSAILDMVRMIEAVQSRYNSNLTATDPLTGQAFCTINLIQGGSAPNVIPDRCAIQIDRRVVPGEDIRQVTDSLADAMEPLRQEDPQLQFDFTLDVSHPPLNCQKNGRLLKISSEVLRAVGRKPLPLGAPFTTHASYLQQTGVPTIVLGPGESQNAHKKDEWISVEQLDLGVKVYLGLMKENFDGL